eukprot:403357865
MNYQKVQQLPRIVKSQQARQMAKAPNYKYKGYRDLDIDIFQLYKTNAQMAANPSVGRRMDPDQRDEYIQAQKQKLGLNEKLLPLSSKRTIVGDQLYKNPGYLEFNQYFNNINGTHLFKPHEMQWSLKNYSDKEMAMYDEGERRIEESITKGYHKCAEFEKRVHQVVAEKAQASNDQTIQKELEKVKRREGKSDIFDDDLNK